MELTDNYFKKLKEKKDMSKRNINFYYLLAREYKSSNQLFSANVISNIIRRMEDCLEYWQWDKYSINKILNLKIVSRCKNKFCANCRTVNIIKAISKFKPYFENMIKCGFSPYLMTLTSPNIELEQLSNEINKMNKAFLKFIRWLDKPFKENNKYYGGFKDRLFDVKGAIKVLEVTVQKNNLNMFHVHFHVILFLLNDKEKDFVKYRPGGFQRRTGREMYYSDADTLIQMLWKMAYDSKDITKFKDTSERWQDNFICEIRKMDSEHGIYEVFKYCFKDMDIKTYEIFKNLYIGLKGRRLRQGYGKLYNLKLDDDALDHEELTVDDINNYLEFKDEEPVSIYNFFNDNMENYGDYKKISIFKRKI